MHGLPKGYNTYITSLFRLHFVKQFFLVDFILVFRANKVDPCYELILRTAQYNKYAKLRHIQSLMHSHYDCEDEH